MKDVKLDKTLIKGVTDLYIAMGGGTLDAYTQDFECAFLESSRYIVYTYMLYCVYCQWCHREYYNRVSNSWKEYGIVTYIQNVETALIRESDRAKHYLHYDTELKLLRVCGRCCMCICMHMCEYCMYICIHMYEYCMYICMHMYEYCFIFHTLALRLFMINVYMIN